MPTIPNQPSEASAHFMFELAKTVLTKAGGNSSTSLFTQPTNNNNPVGSHRALHLCAFQIGLYALGSFKIPVAAFLATTSLTRVTPVVIVVGELLSLIAIVVLGKQGFKDIKNRVLKLFKRKPVEELEPVSRFRHVTGLFLVLLIPFMLQATATTFAVVSHSAATLQEPFPEVWGMTFDFQLTFFLILMIGAELCIMTGFFMLGGLWWERFRRLFIWPGNEDKALGNNEKL